MEKIVIDREVKIMLLNAIRVGYLDDKAADKLRELLRLEIHRNSYFANIDPKEIAEILLRDAK